MTLDVVAPMVAVTHQCPPSLRATSSTVTRMPYPLVDGSTAVAIDRTPVAALRSTVIGAPADSSAAVVVAVAHGATTTATLQRRASGARRTLMYSLSVVQVPVARHLGLRG